MLARSQEKTNEEKRTAETKALGAYIYTMKD